MERVRKYETTYIVRPDISDAEADRVTTRAFKAIVDTSGKVLSVDNWGKRRLAYEIAHHQKGIFFHWHYVAGNKCVAELERNLRMLEPVIRFLTVRISDQVNYDEFTGLKEDEIPYRKDSDENAATAPPPVEAAPEKESKPAAKEAVEAAPEEAAAEEAEAPAEEAAEEAAPEEAVEAAPEEAAAEEAAAEEAAEEEESSEKKDK